MSVTFADIRAMLSEVSAWDLTVPDGFEKRAQNLSATTRRALGVFAAAQAKPWPVIKHPRVALYACACEDGQAETEKRLQDLAEGKDAALRFCGLANADLRVYELDMTKVVSDEASLAHALSYGLMAADEHVDALIVDSVSENFRVNISDDPLAALKSQDEAAVLGAVLGARLAKIPVLCAHELAAPLKSAVEKLLPDNASEFIISFSDAETKNFPRRVRGLASLMTLKTALALFPEASSTIQLTQAA
jgi:hypothetical protein